MADGSLHATLKNIDARLTKVEQILPGLATRDELQAAIAGAVAPLATRDELHELRVLFEQDRQRWSMMFEDLRDDNRIILEHLVALSTRVDALARR